MLVEGAEARYIVGQAQPAGLGATFEALAGAKEPTEAVRILIQLGEVLRARGGHLLRGQRSMSVERLEPALTPKADRQKACV